jgi:rubrerythrin
LQIVYNTLKIITGGVDMTDNKEKMVCSQCGYTTAGSFTGDICPQCGMTFWKCEQCGFRITAGSPPETCPACKKKCEFVNITCYTPECGGPGNVDPRL